ncbi:MAG: hypothetical protein COU26_01785 [Candidatus Levybacteria bacterium CG10_big_fil_rev_8_21_14_0_10_36_30]|nr:MAG: hypothetical protein COU26_01785 [Candidatus Levybacteria bacterium CG10_big_fil_rev_8_21_14_0_10_36_30]
MPAKSTKSSRRVLFKLSKFISLTESTGLRLSAFLAFVQQIFQDFTSNQRCLIIYYFAQKDEYIKFKTVLKYDEVLCSILQYIEE